MSNPSFPALICPMVFQFNIPKQLSSCRQQLLYLHNSCWKYLGENESRLGLFEFRWSCWWVFFLADCVTSDVFENLLNVAVASSEHLCVCLLAKRYQTYHQSVGEFDDSSMALIMLRFEKVVEKFSWPTKQKMWWNYSQVYDGCTFFHPG